MTAEQAIKQACSHVFGRYDTLWRRFLALVPFIDHAVRGSKPQPLGLAIVGGYFSVNAAFTAPLRCICFLTV